MGIEGPNFGTPPTPPDESGQENRSELQPLLEAIENSNLTPEGKTALSEYITSSNSDARGSLFSNYLGNLHRLEFLEENNKFGERVAMMRNPFDRVLTYMIINPEDRGPRTVGGANVTYEIWEHNNRPD